MQTDLLQHKFLHIAFRKGTVSYCDTQKAKRCQKTTIKQCIANKTVTHYQTKQLLTIKQNRHKKQRYHFKFRITHKQIYMQILFVCLMLVFFVVLFLPYHKISPLLTDSLCCQRTIRIKWKWIWWTFSKFHSHLLCLNTVWIGLSSLKHKTCLFPYIPQLTHWDIQDKVVVHWYFHLKHERSSIIMSRWGSLFTLLID